MLYPNLLEQLNPKVPLLQLAKIIPWEYFENEFSFLYKHRNDSAKLIRLMLGLCILKHLENLSDDELIERWLQNPYYQAFCGETEFQWKIPYNSSDVAYFYRCIKDVCFSKYFWEMTARENV